MRYKNPFTRERRRLEYRLGNLEAKLGLAWAEKDEDGDDYPSHTIKHRGFWSTFERWHDNVSKKLKISNKDQVNQSMYS